MTDRSAEKPIVSPAPEPVSGPPTRTRASHQMRRVFRGRLGTGVGLILFGIIFILIWEGAFRVRIVSPFIIPSALDTLEEFHRIFQGIFTGTPVLQATLITLEEIAAGFVLGAFAGIILGVVIGETAFGRKILMPYVVAFNAMPKVAFAPLFVAALGFGLAPKILLAAIIAFFPVVVNTAAGIESPTDNELMLFRAIDSSRWQTLWKLKFPTALPYVFAGLKIAAVLAVIGAVVGEMLSGGTGGLGRRISVASLNLKTDSVFALIVVLSIVGLVVFLVVAVVEHYVVHWRQPKWRRR